MATTTQTEVKPIPTIAASVIDGSLVLNFSNGARVTVDPRELSMDIIREATLHGLKQKLMDCAAIPRDSVTGKSATVADKFEAVLECAERLLSEDGTWNKTRESTGGANNKGGLLPLAVMELTGKTREDVTVFLEAKTKDEITALRANPRIATIITRLSAARSKSTIDSEALLNGLMG